MARTINPIKKELVKQGLLQGKSQRQALKDAGYYPDGNASKDNRLLNTIKAEIFEEIKGKVTVEYVLNNLFTLAETAKSEADRIRANELLGKYLAMFTEKHLVDANIITKQEQSLLDKYVNDNRLSNIPCS